MTILMVTLFPFALKAQVKDTVPTYSMTGYALGAYSAQVTAREIVAVAGARHKVLVLGLADGNPWRSCGKNKQCSDHKNQLLADIRASEAAKALESVGLDTARITTRGEIRNTRGEAYRGVVIYVLREKIVVPNDSLATVTKAVDTLQTDMKSVKAKVEKLDTAVTQVTNVVQQMIDNTNADTGKKNEDSTKKSNAGLDIGLNYSMGQGFTFGPAIGIGIGNGYKFVAQGGIFPNGKNKSLNCSLMNISAAVGIERNITFEGEEAIWSFGALTDRTACYNGGPKVAETLTLRYDGIFVGGGWRMNLGSDRFRPTLTAQGTLGLKTTNKNQDPKLRPGIRLGLRIPLFGGSSKDSTTHR